MSISSDIKFSESLILYLKIKYHWNFVVIIMLVEINGVVVNTHKEVRGCNKISLMSPGWCCD